MESKTHRLTFSTEELILMHTVMYNSTVKGEVAIQFGCALDKIQKEIQKAQEELKQKVNGDKDKVASSK